MKQFSVFCTFALSPIIAFSSVSLEPVTVSEPKEPAKIFAKTQVSAKTPSQDAARMINLVDVEIKRSSTIGGEIFISGLGSSDIGVVLDDIPVGQACPNHMDPPSSRANPLDLKKIEVVSGPFDLSTAGSLGGRVNFVSKDWDIEKQNEYYYTVDTWGGISHGFRSGFALGGFDAAINWYSSQSGAYEDGNNAKVTSKTAYLNQDQDMHDLTKFSFSLNREESSTIRWNLKLNSDRTDFALYPAKPMDSVLDDSDSTSFTWEHNPSKGDLQRLKIQIFQTRIEHVMDNFTFRKALAKMTTFTKSNVSGVRVDSVYAHKNGDFHLGLDIQNRDWNAFSQTGMAMLDTANTLHGIFAEHKIQNNDLIWTFGFRADKIESLAGATSVANIKKVFATDLEWKENLFSGFITLRKNLEKDRAFTWGVGLSSRAPEPNELWFNKGGTATTSGWIGNPDLNPSENLEFRVGYEWQKRGWNSGVSLFTRELRDFIYLSERTAAGINYKTLDNIDAYMNGLVFTTLKALKSDLELGFELAWQEGKKDSFPNGNSNRNLAQIPPMKGNISLKKACKNGQTELKLNWSEKSNEIDSLAGEVSMPGYATIDLNHTHQWKQSEISFFILNLTDKDYALQNSYDRDPINPTTVVLNEPGRTVGMSVRIRF